MLHHIHKLTAFNEISVAKQLAAHLGGILLMLTVSHIAESLFLVTSFKFSYEHDAVADETSSVLDILQELP